MKKLISCSIMVLLLSLQSNAFCGFYVAKAGSELYNNKSEVILVRDGNNTTITMSNDFKGNVKDFAMVVPVPNVLNREDIRVVDRTIFASLDAYSSPRLVEYFDPNPCQIYANEVEDAMFESDKSLSMIERTSMNREAKKYKVKIEAVYNVEEYEILILSAKDSDGLKNWLVKNGYKIPEKAEQVLEPYIKNKLKFFVVKVDLNKYNPQANGGYLRPLQIDVSSNKFMLPIRLGMANANGEQDMIVYSFSKKGRVECTNYRTVEIPTNRNIPTFVKPSFGNFYKDVFRNAHQREGRNAVFLEYAWNVTPNWGGMKCDPCVGNPPYFTDLQKAGVSWLGNGNAPVFFTRLHVRYSLDKFPEDLFFQITPNKDQFQARYILNHPATGDLSCKSAEQYMKKLKRRRSKEMHELAALAQWDTRLFYDYVENGTDLVREVNSTNDRNEVGIPYFKNTSGGSAGKQILFGLAVFLLLITSVIQLFKKRLA